MMIVRRRRSFVLAMLVMGGVAGCSREQSPPRGTRWLEEGESHWRGWIELVPAIPTPQFDDGRDDTRVYARFPDGASITLADAADRRSLRVPEGATLDRVERTRVRGALRVADVRGTTFAPEGERFHAYRPYDGRGTMLFGVAWPRSESVPAQVLDAFAAAMRAGHGSVLPGAGAPQRIERFGRLLECAGCHRSRQPERLGGGAEWPRRRTDARGLYSLLATLEDSAIVETYRPRHDALRGAHFAREGPSATFAVAQALAAGDPHARALCQSRRTLLRFLSPPVRRAYGAELQACGIRPDAL